MKAWRIYGPLDTRLEETETPVPKENEVILVARKSEHKKIAESLGLILLNNKKGG